MSIALSLETRRKQEKLKCRGHARSAYKETKQIWRQKAHIWQRHLGSWTAEPTCAPPCPKASHWPSSKVTATFSLSVEPAQHPKAQPKWTDRHSCCRTYPGSLSRCSPAPLGTIVPLSSSTWSNHLHSPSGNVLPRHLQCTKLKKGNSCEGLKHTPNTLSCANYS